MRRKIVVSGVAMVAMTTAGMLTALAPPVAAASGGTIKVAYQNYGTNITLNTLMQKVGGEFQKAYPGWTVDLEPIAAPENPYYTKLDLMSQSASTAPDILYEDTFLVNSDTAAGYLAPLNSYLAKWSGWSQYSAAAKAAAKGVNGQIYGVSMGTDTRGLWYNKTLLKQGRDRRPLAAQELGRHHLAAARPSRRPSRASSRSTSTPASGPAKPAACRASRCSCTGPTTPCTTRPPTSGRRPAAGWQAALNIVQDALRPGPGRHPAGPRSTPTGAPPWVSRTCPRASWPSTSTAAGSPVTGHLRPRAGWRRGPQWSQTMGVAAMPTENGQGAGKVSLSGGWLLSVGSHATNKQMAFNFITIALDYQNALFYDIGAGQIATRADVAAAPSYKASNASITGVFQLRALHPLPPRLHRLPEALQRDPGDHRARS